MSHENYKYRLLQYFYQELLEKERKEFEAHLSKYPFCKADLENLKAMAKSQVENFLEGSKPSLCSMTRTQVSWNRSWERCGFLVHPKITL